MKKMQSYRIEAQTIEQIDKIGQSEKRTKSNVIEMAIEKYYQELRGENKMNEKWLLVRNMAGGIEIVKEIQSRHGFWSTILGVFDTEEEAELAAPEE